MPPTAPELRIAIVAENASFRFGGEASLPLHYFSRLRARGMEAWLIVHGRNQQELEALYPGEQDRIQYIPDRWFHKLLWQAIRVLPRRVAQATFGAVMMLINQIIQRGMVRELVRRHRVNIVHQPIPVSPVEPSFLFGLGVPVIIGPMNGGMNYPAAFRHAESLFTRTFVAFSRSCSNWVNSLVPGKKQASLLLVANHRTRLALPGCATKNILEMPENGVDLKIWTLPSPDAPRSATPRYIFVGRLIDLKRLDLVMRALLLVPDAVLDVIGEGEMRPAWSAMAQDLGLADRVRFIGWLPQAECAERLQAATALVLPSICECGGAVVLEAMATGTPAIAVNWGGPVDYIDAGCGFLADPASEETIVQGFADAMRALGGNPELRARLGATGRKKMEDQYDWDRKIDHILELYCRAVADASNAAL
jgi:glycosyltransferase involved in cell wall biosynthesis